MRSAIVLAVVAGGGLAARAEDLYSNSGSFTAPLGFVMPTAGCDGAPVSPLQKSIGLITIAFSASASGKNVVADDIAVPLPPGTKITELEFYCYQTTATSPTVTECCYAFYESDPLTKPVPKLTCVPVASVMTDTYRAFDDNLAACNRRIQVFTVPVDPPYEPLGEQVWVLWRIDGVLTNGPFVPTIVEEGQPAPPAANARQAVNGAPFSEVHDSGPTFANVAFPFIVRGVKAGGCKWDLDGDGKVCQGDLGQMLAGFGTTYFQGDLGELLAQYNGGCGAPCVP